MRNFNMWWLMLNKHLPTFPFTKSNVISHTIQQINVQLQNIKLLFGFGIEKYFALKFAFKVYCPQFLLKIDWIGW